MSLLRISLLSFLCLGGLSMGCDEESASGAAAGESLAPTHTGADLLPRSPELAEYPEAEPGDALGALLFDRARTFARHLEADGEIERGTVRRSAHAEHFFVAEGGRCYQVFGAAVEGVRDLDLLLFDEGMTLVQQDSTPDATPMLGLTNPICPRQTVRYRVRVRAFRGEGEYGLLVTRTAPHLF